MSNLTEFFRDFKKAQDSADPMVMLSVMEQFFTSIYNVKPTEADYRLPALYSAASQIEAAYGIDTKVIRRAISAKAKDFVGRGYFSNLERIMKSLEKETVL